MASTSRLTPESLKQQMSAFEERYGLTSVEFLAKYQSGTMGDSRDVMRWAWLCSVALKLGLLATSTSRSHMTA